MRPLCPNRETPKWQSRVGHLTFPSANHIANPDRLGGFVGLACGGRCSRFEDLPRFPYDDVLAIRDGMHLHAHGGINRVWERIAQRHAARARVRADPKAVTFRCVTVTSWRGRVVE